AIRFITWDRHRSVSLSTRDSRAERLQVPSSLHPTPPADRMCAASFVRFSQRLSCCDLPTWSQGYAAGLISVVVALLPITPKANGIVVRPPTSARASPAALR